MAMNTNDVEPGGEERLRWLESKLTTILGPYEPMIMNIQSLLVWEHPRKSAVVFVIGHLLFWFICTTSVRFFFVLSLVVICLVFIDTWKNKIWPEIRVPPKEPEDKDGWTPVHLRLLSVPEISFHLSHLFDWHYKTFHCLRSYRLSHPLVFCLGNSAFFTITALLGYYVSGFMLTYLISMGFMLWPCVSYNSLIRKVYHKMEPNIQRLGALIKSRLGFLASYTSIFRSKKPENAEHNRPISLETNFEPEVGPEVAAALRKAVSDSDEDDTPTSTIPTPGLSKNPSFTNSEDDRQETDFDLDLSLMPSFDDFDNTDDEFDLPPKTPDGPTSRLRSGKLSGLQFTAGHFGDLESEEDILAENLDFFEGNLSSNSNSLSSHPAIQNLAGAFVSRTITSMMESALHGVASLREGQKASSSSLLSHTGAKITYTVSEGGESVDFQNPQPTIPEFDEEEEEEDDYGRNEQIAEIEKDFDFLDDLGDDK